MTSPSGDWNFDDGSSSAWAPESGSGAPPVQSARDAPTAQWEPDVASPGLDSLPNLQPAEPSFVRTNILLLVGLLAAGVGIALGLVAHQKPAIAATGWVLASIGCIGSVAAYSYQDAKRRAADWLAASSPRGYGRFAVLGVGVAAIVINAWQFADWAAR